MEIKHNNQKFYIEKDNVIIAYIYYEFYNENVINVLSTVVDESLRGQGVAKKLMEEVILFAQKNNYKIIPTCSFAKKYLSDKKELNIIYE